MRKKGVTKSLSRHLLSHPHTTLIAATRHLTPSTSGTLRDLPKHDTCVVIPVKIDLYSRYDAAGVVRGLHFAGVGRVDGIVVAAGGGADGGAGADRVNGVNGVNSVNGSGNGEYVDGVVMLLRHFRVLLSEEAKVVVLGRGGSGREVWRRTEVVSGEGGDLIPFTVEWYVSCISLSSVFLPEVLMAAVIRIQIPRKMRGQGGYFNW